MQANNNDSLRIVCAYHRTLVPGRGSSIVFQPLEHLQPMHFSRRKDLPLSMMGSRILDLHACRTSLEVAEVFLTTFSSVSLFWHSASCHVPHLTKPQLSWCTLFIFDHLDIYLTGRFFYPSTGASCCDGRRRSYGDLNMGNSYPLSSLVSWKRMRHNSLQFFLFITRSSADEHCNLSTAVKSCKAHSQKTQSQDAALIHNSAGLQSGISVHPLNALCQLHSD